MANKESGIQASIIKYLTGLGWYVVKVSAATRGGTPDLLCCDTYGCFWAFEVKANDGVVSKLQEFVIEKIRKTGGSAHVVHSLQQVKTIIENVGS